MMPVPISQRATANLAWRLPRLWPFLRAVGPVYLIVALVGVLGGAAVVGATATIPLIGLLFAMTCLHAGGDALQAAYDGSADLHGAARKRPPAGAGFVLAAVLLTSGLVVAFAVQPIGGAMALAIALVQAFHSGWGKHHGLFAPLGEATKAALHLALGMSAIPPLLLARGYVAAIPLLYIIAVALMRRHETDATASRTILLPLIALVSALVSLIALVHMPEVNGFAMPFTALLAFRTLPCFAYATATGEHEAVRYAVRAGALNLIVLDATLAAGFAGPWIGLAILALLPLSLPLARRFPVF